MKCPNCGEEIPEGMLYCEKCGTEILMVPEFDPDFDNQINEPLEHIADYVDDHDSGSLETEGEPAPEDSMGDFTEPLEDGGFTKELDFEKRISDKITSRFSGLSHRVTKWIAHHPIRFEIICAAVVIALGILIFGMIQKNSGSQTEKLIQSAENAMSQENYQEAAGYLEQAYIADEKNAGVIFSLAQAYEKAGNEEKAVEALMRILDSAAFTDEEEEQAYEQIARIYSDGGDLDALNDLMARCPYPKVREIYESLVPDAPTISIESGEFEEAFSVTILADKDMDIYYTLDGTSPGIHSILYEAPIEFTESGEYTLQAVAVDREGNSSDIAIEEYQLLLKIPSAPQVMEDSGNYSKNTKIVVIAAYDCQVYYTTDGSRPTQDSLRYTSPIQMPYGDSTFRFICYNDEGYSSEETRRNYHLEFVKKVSEEQAITSVMQTLMAQGVLLDMNGDALGVAGTYQYNVTEVIYIQGSGEYYKITETHRYADGRTEDTGYLYAVDTQTGAPYRLSYDSSGDYFLVKMGNG